MFLSIITPVYNSFSLMNNYFLSFSNQKNKDFEIIIIDDCSTDQSYQQLLEYKNNNQHLNIQVHRVEKNAGPGNARNLGISKASGNYLTFIDSDDFVDDDIINHLYKVVEDVAYDCVIFDRYKVKNNKKSTSPSLPNLEEGVTDNKIALESLTNYGAGLMYKRELLINNNILFPKVKRCEDIYFSGIAIVKANNVYYLKMPLYYYVQHKVSLSNNNKMSHDDMVISFNLLVNDIDDIAFSDSIKNKSVKDLLYGVVLMMAKSKASSKAIKNYILNYENEYINWDSYSIVKKLNLFKRLFLFCIKHKFILGIRVLTKIHSALI